MSEIEYVEFNINNPYHQCYTHGIIDHKNNCIGLYYGKEFKHHELYSRYLKGVELGRILTMAEYDTILYNNNNKPIKVKRYRYDIVRLIIINTGIISFVLILPTELGITTIKPEMVTFRLYFDTIIFSIFILSICWVLFAIIQNARNKEN